MPRITVTVRELPDVIRQINSHAWLHEELCIVGAAEQPASYQIPGVLFQGLMEALKNDTRVIRLNLRHCQLDRNWEESKDESVLENKEYQIQLLGEMLTVNRTIESLDVGSECVRGNETNCLVR